MSIVGKYELLSDPADKAWDEYLIAVGNYFCQNFIFSYISFS